MSSSRGIQGFLRCGSTSIASFPDPLLLHIRDLSQHRDNEFADTFPDDAKAMNIDGDAHDQKTANHRLNIESVTAQTADIINV